MEPDLAQTLGTELPARHQVAGVATVAAGVVRSAVVGADPGSDFEIGSVSKAVTGLLYDDALARAVVRQDTTLGDLLPLGDCPASAVTLATLASHRSGLPRLPSAMSPLRRTLELWWQGTNPYREDLAELLEHTRSEKVGRPRPSYSNLGYELLGHALASADGTSYRDLVLTRLCDPLRLTTTYVPYSPADLQPTALPGRTRRGRPTEPWTGEAVAPAGGVRSSVEDLGTLLAALLEGSAPGLGALEPRHTFRGGVRIGAAWLTLEHRGRSITWHNGRTGGFASWVGLDREAGTGLALVSATSASLDRYGFRMLAELRTG